MAELAPLLEKAIFPEENFTLLKNLGVVPHWVRSTAVYPFFNANYVIVTVASETSPPRVTITSPADKARLLDPIVMLEGTAQDNVAVERVEYQIRDSAFQSAVGTLNWTATLALLPGTNLVRVRARDTSGNISSEARRSLIYVATSPFSLEINGNGMVTPNLNGQRLELGKSYTLKAKPASGNVFSNWVGDISSTNPTLAFSMSSNLALIANFVVNPFAALKGTYHGLFYIDPAIAWDSSGFFNLTLTDKGKFTGKLRLAGSQYPVSGQFDLALHATKSVVRVGASELLVSLQLAQGSDRITGSVRSAEFVSALNGYRTTFGRTNPATSFAGKYTMLVSGGANAASSPFGQGIVALAVSTAGAVTLKGTLADGSTASQSAPVSANGQVPLYAPLYNAKGSIFGWLTFSNAARSDVQGSLLWTKTGGVPGVFYPAGFTNYVETLGARYTPPTAGARVLELTSALVRLEGGNLESVTTNEVLLDALNKVAVSSTNTNKLGLTLTVPTGLIAGKFANPTTGKPSSIKGTLLRKPGVNAGGGFFTGTNQSGVFYLGLPETFPLFAP